MSETLLPHPVATLALLGELEVQEAVLYARRAQALVDYREECLRVPRQGRPAEFIALDLAVECQIAQVTASSRLAAAERLVEGLPRTHARLLAGELRVGQALVLLEETNGVDPEVALRLEEQVLPQVLGCTAGETRRLVKQALVRLDGQAAEQRRQQRHAERRVFRSGKPDGRAFLGVHGSAEAVGVFWEEVTLLAKLTFGTDDPRTLDQQRADLLLSLSGFALSSRHGHGSSLRSYLGLADEHAPGGCSLARRNDLTPAQQRRVQAVVLVPVQTGLGLADDPGELVGYGPVSGQHARDLLAAAELRQACADLSSGRVVALSDDRVRPPAWSGRYWGSAHVALQEAEVLGDGGPHRPEPRHDPPPERPAGPASPITLFDALLAMVGTPLPAEARVEDRHDPSAGLADLVRLRDTRCIGPGCSLPSPQCDLEHWRPWPLGTTSADNLGPASRRCHNAKTYGGWSFTPHPDGSVTWTTPWGQTYRKASSTRPIDVSDLAPRPVGKPPHQRPLEP